MEKRNKFTTNVVAQKGHICRDQATMLFSERDFSKTINNGFNEIQAL